MFFFDTPDLKLYEHGVVARARRTQAKPDDSVIKIRPVIPNELSKELRGPKTSVSRWTRYQEALSARLPTRESLRPARLRSQSEADAPLSKLFSKQQRAFFRSRTRPTALSWTTFSILGPINVMKLKFAPEGFARKLRGKAGAIPAGPHFELSTKCQPGEAFHVAAETRAFPERTRRGSRRQARDQNTKRACLLLKGLAGLNRLASRERRSDRLIVFADPKHVAEAQIARAGGGGLGSGRRRSGSDPRPRG